MWLLQKKGRLAFTAAVRLCYACIITMLYARTRIMEGNSTLLEDHWRSIAPPAQLGAYGVISKGTVRSSLCALPALRSISSAALAPD